MSYTVTYERDETGWWFASIKELQGCHTQGKTIEQAKKRIREALELFTESSEAIQLVDDIRLPSNIQQLLLQYNKVHQEAKDKQTEAIKKSIQAAKVLTEDLNLSLRDTGKLLGLSHQRVQQLVSER